VALAEHFEAWLNPGLMISWKGLSLCAVKGQIHSLTSPASVWAQTYGYDDVNRLHSLTSPAGTFDYTYNSGLDGATSSSSLVGEITLPNGGYISDTYDVNGRMTGALLYSSVGSNLDSSAYTYNKANQRTQIVRNNENYVNYTYDKIGEVISD
jgi:uncharacterized protein RhaS with RHS repeats